MYFDRCVSILSDIIGTRIEYWHWFELSWNESVDYTIDVSTPLDFGKDFVNDLTELVSLSVPTLEVDGDWSFVNEYFQQTRSDRFQEFRTDRLDVRCHISDSRFN